MANYCSAADAATMTGRPDTAIEQWWLDTVDGLIERYTGQGYKGAERTFTHIGRGTETIKLPSRAYSISSITENGDTLATADYVLEPSGRLIERQNTNYMSALYGARAGRWYPRYKYVVTYIEPDMDQAPTNEIESYRMAAADCVATVAMFLKKRKEYGIALSASDAGQAGKVSTASTTSFPAALIDDLRRIITGTVKRGNI